MAKITKKMTLGEVIKKYPETADVFLEHGLPCFGCQMAAYETIEQGAKGHGIDLVKLLKGLNKKISKKK